MIQQRKNDVILDDIITMFHMRPMKCINPKIFMNTNLYNSIWQIMVGTMI